jgi:predicted nucleic acid-binding protein
LPSGKHEEGEGCMVIVDSSVWIDALNGRITPQTIWLGMALDREQLGLTSLILCEVLQGIRFDRRFRETEDRLRTFPVFAALTSDLAVATAQNFRTLQRMGFTVRKTIDCFIATFCIAEGHQLLHHDRDFELFEKHLGLRVVHPPAVASN